jgi:hypothetical protein
MVRYTAAYKRTLKVCTSNDSKSHLRVRAGRSAAKGTGVANGTGRK